MKAHADIQRMLAVYPSLDRVQQRIVDEHVGVCRACAEVRSAYRALDQQVAGLNNLPLPLTLAGRWSAPVRAERRAGGSSPWLTPVLLPRVVLPVVLLLILACGVWLLIHLSSPTSPGIAETPSVTPSATPIVLASRRPVALAIIAHEPTYSAAQLPCSPNSLGYLGAATAPTTETPVASEIAGSTTAPVDRQDSATVWRGMPVMLELPLARH